MSRDFLRRRAARRVRAAFVLWLVLASGCIRGAASTSPVEPFDCSQTSYIGMDGFSPTWSSDGRRVAYLAGFDANGRFNSGLYVCDVASGESHVVLPYAAIGYVGGGLEWNPRPGSQLVLLSYGLSAAIADLESGKLSMIAPEDGQLFAAMWTPEGDSIAYTHQGTVGEGEFSVSLTIQAPDGSGRHRFIREGGHSIQSDKVTFSPDGQWLAWPEYVPTNTYSRTEIAVCRRDGTGFRRLTSLGGQARRPVWIQGVRGMLFPWISEDCAAIGGNGPHTTMYVDLSSGHVRPWQCELTDYRFQFSKDIHVDRSGTRALVPGLNPLFDVPSGALYLTSTNYTGVRRKLALSSPPPPPPPPPPIDP